MSKTAVGTYRILPDGSIQGWAFIEGSDEVAEIVVRTDGRQPIVVVADCFRQDVLEQGLHVTGNCGFTLPHFDLPVGAASESIVLTVRQTGQKLFNAYCLDQLENFPIIFIHVPKTAGTSFRVAAQRVYGANAMLFDYGKTSDATSSAVLDTVYSGNKRALLDKFKELNTRLFFGHFTAGQYLSMFGRRAKWCAFVRNPIQRVISDYKHMVRNYSYKRSIEEFCRSEDQMNRQFKFLKGIDLQEMYFLGLTERYDESIALFNKISGLSISRIEMNKGKENIDDNHEEPQSIIDLIVECNKNDIALYAEAKCVFEKRITDG